MINVKCILVASPPGARSDFVAGWLGTLLGFVDNHWEIDPLTGMSSGRQRLTKILDKPDHITLRERLAQYDMQLSAASELTFAGSIHGYRLVPILKNKIIKPRVPWDEYNQSFKILHIRVPEHDQAVMDKIRWEFFCKSYLSGQYDWSVIKNEPSLDIAKLSEQEFSTFHQFDNHTLRHSIPVDYTQLFVPGGSVHLCELLGIEATEEDHEIWDQSVPQADSPEELTQFGRVWRKADHSIAIRS